MGSLLVGGVAADRLGPKNVMVAADLLRLGAQTAIAILLLSGQAMIAEIAISQALIGVGSGFFNPSSSGLLPNVAGEHLQQANSLKGMAMARPATSPDRRSPARSWSPRARARH